jgi:hypothetical protein
MKTVIAGCAIAKSVLKDVDILGKISFFEKLKCLIVIFLETEQTVSQARDVWKKNSIKTNSK